MCYPLPLLHRANDAGYPLLPSAHFQYHLQARGKQGIPVAWVGWCTGRISTRNQQIWGHTAYTMLTRPDNSVDAAAVPAPHFHTAALAHLPLPAFHLQSQLPVNSRA